MFICLYSTSSKPILLNIQYIMSVEYQSISDCTIITTRSGHTYAIEETVEEVIEALDQIAYEEIEIESEDKDMN